MSVWQLAVHLIDFDLQISAMIGRQGPCEMATHPVQQLQHECDRQTDRQTDHTTLTSSTSSTAWWWWWRWYVTYVLHFW